MKILAGESQIGERGIKSDPCINTINPYNRILTLKTKGNKLVDEVVVKKYAMLIVSIANGKAELEPEDRKFCLDIVSKVKTRKPNDKVTAIGKISSIMKRCGIKSQEQDHQKIYDHMITLV